MSRKKREQMKAKKLRHRKREAAVEKVESGVESDSQAQAGTTQRKDSQTDAVATSPKDSLAVAGTVPRHAAKYSSKEKRSQAHSNELDAPHLRHAAPEWQRLYAAVAAEFQRHGNDARSS